MAIVATGYKKQLDARTWEYYFVTKRILHERNIIPTEQALEQALHRVSEDHSVGVYRCRSWIGIVVRTTQAPRPSSRSIRQIVVDTLTSPSFE